MAHFIMFTSGKGGVGKTTITYKVGLSLARNNHKVLLLDADVGLKNLDLVSKAIGVSSYDLYDVYNGSASFEEALSKIGPNLDLLSLYGSTTLSYLKDEVILNFANLLNESYDYVLIDSPAGLEKGFEMTRVITEKFVIVLNPTLTSFHDASKVLQVLKRNKALDISLILNRFSRKDLEFFKTRGNVLKEYEVLGILPELTKSFWSNYNFAKTIDKIARTLSHSYATEGI